jgi:hypothetical protein
LLPAEFKFATNDRVYNDDGVQIAEFDVHIMGKIGTTASDGSSSAEIVLSADRRLFPGLNSLLDDASASSSTR